MTARQFHWLEKFQIQVATLVAAVAAYKVIWPAVIPSDPQLPATFLATGNFGGIIDFAVGIWLIAGCCAILTVTARPEGALVSVVIGACAMALRSPQVRSLLWLQDGLLGGLYIRFMVEIIILTAVFFYSRSSKYSAPQAPLEKSRASWLWCE